MIKAFLRHYFELPAKLKNIVCLGGGVGTAQILKGLRKFDLDLVAVVSMADDGGSAGRLRRAFSIPPPGDIVNCLAALSDEENVLKDLFVYRFAGKRYGKDTDLGGHKLGNLIFAALTDIYKGDLNKAFVEFSKIISTKGKVLPATTGDVNIWALTKSGKKIYGEENIDLGKYNSDKTLKEVHLDPPNIKAYKQTVDALNAATTIVAGPGDLFSNLLPVLIVPQIKTILLKSQARKIYIVNIANKEFETPNFQITDYLNIINKHMDKMIFDYIIVNTNQKPNIPNKLNYKYVKNDFDNLTKFKNKIIEGDFVDESFPLYHDSDKIARVIQKLCK